MSIIHIQFKPKITFSQLTQHILFEIRLPNNDPAHSLRPNILTVLTDYLSVYVASAHRKYVSNSSPQKHTDSYMNFTIILAIRTMVIYCGHISSRAFSYQHPP